MIEYEEEWLAGLIFKKQGSVAIQASLYALPSATIAVLLLYLDEWAPHVRVDTGMLDINQGYFWSATTGVLVLLLGFRTRQAFSRFWEGTGLLHQMRGEWFDTVSNCVSFSIGAKGSQPQQVMEFRHAIIRLMSLCHGSALEEIADNGIKLESIDVFGLNDATLGHLQECHHNYHFNKVEVMLHLLQSLITSALDEGILKIPPPICSRVYQTISRGFVNLLNAKKIQDTKFPFPYVQLGTCLLFMQIVLTPMMMTILIKSKLLAALFTFVPLWGMFCLNFVGCLWKSFRVRGSGAPRRTKTFREQRSRRRRLRMGRKWLQLQSCRRRKVKGMGSFNLYGSEGPSACRNGACCPWHRRGMCWFAHDGVFDWASDHVPQVPEDQVRLLEEENRNLRLLVDEVRRENKMMQQQMQRMEAEFASFWETVAQQEQATRSSNDAAQDSSRSSRSNRSSRSGRKKLNKSMKEEPIKKDTPLKVSVPISKPETYSIDSDYSSPSVLEAAGWLEPPPAESSNSASDTEEGLAGIGGDQDLRNLIREQDACQGPAEVADILRDLHEASSAAAGAGVASTPQPTQRARWCRYGLNCCKENCAFQHPALEVNVAKGGLGAGKGKKDRPGFIPRRKK